MSEGTAIGKGRSKLSDTELCDPANSAFVSADPRARG